MQTITKQEMHAGIEVIRAVADSIRELKQVPAGHLYAVLMGSMSLDGFNKIIRILKNAGLVREDESHLLHWIEVTPLAAS
jgi:hypothetical protein